MNKKIALLWSLLAVCAYADGETTVNLDKSVIYSTTGFETAVKDTVKNVTVVTSKEIEEKNYQTVTDILKDIPSVNVIGDPRAPIIDMRGQGKAASTNVQVLIDGVSINLSETSHANTPINTVPVESIERIEVIPGGGSILYGGGTRGGIINIITKAGAGYNGGAFGAEYTSFGGKKTDVEYGTTLGKLGVNVGYTRDEYKGFRDEDESDSDYFQTTLKYDISNDKKITFKYSRFEEEATHPESLSKEEADRDPEQSGLVGGSYNKIETTKNDFNLKYEQKLTNNIDFNILAFYQNMDLDINQFYGNMNMLSKMKMDDEKVGIKPKIKINYRENDEIILGYDYVGNELKRTSSIGKTNYLNKLEKETHSVFALNKNKYGKFEFSQGIRYEYAKYDIYRRETSTIDENKNEDNFAIELTTNYLYSDTGNAYIRVERGFTSPAPTQMTDKVDGKYVGNNLDSETYITYEIGAKDYIFGSIVNGTIYYTDTEDEIVTDTNGMTNITNYNIGKTTRYGFELSLEQTISKFTLREGYSYIETEIKKNKNKDYEGNEIPNVPKHKLSIGVDYEVTPKLILGTTVVYEAGYYYDESNKGGKENERIVTNVIANYYPIDSLRIYAGVNNLFDEKYYDSFSDGEYYPAAGRNYTIGFRYNF